MIEIIDQCITLMITAQGKKIYITVVYALNIIEGRRNLWKHLIVLKDLVRQNTWYMAGDFNVLLSLNESSRFDGSQTCSLAMREFRDCLNEVELVDHPYIGSVFTWMNNQEDSFQVRKFDRALVNVAWSFMFVNSSIQDNEGKLLTSQ